jgi:uncharacterized protein (UPF0264 family)
MTGLLVSVRDAAEARLAVEAGVDLVDIKEPRRGALGRADDSTIRQIVAAVGGQAGTLCVPISVALGELVELAPAAALPDWDGIRFAKIGLAGCGPAADWPARWGATFARMPVDVGRVAVVYADWQAARAPQPDEILRVARRLNCSAALVDTFDKRGGGLVDLWTLEQIESFIARARELGLLAVVAGGLNGANIPAIASLAPDYVAVRGAACAGERSGSLSRLRVEELVELVRSPTLLGVRR